MSSLGSDSDWMHWLDTLYEDPLLAVDRDRFEGAAKIIRSSFGDEWLSRELAKPPSRRHELATWGIVGGIPSVWNIRTLAEDIQVTQGARRFDAMLKRLRNPTEFKAAGHELHSAALVARAGVEDLEFAPDVPHGKADFAFGLEGQRIYNECKKLGVSEAENGFLRLFGELRDAIRSIATSTGMGFFEVRVRSKELPLETPLQLAKKAVEDLFKGFRGRFARIVSGPLDLAVFPLRARIQTQYQEPDIGPGGSLFSPPPPRFSVALAPRGVELWTEFEITPGVCVESPWALFLECPRDPREVSRLESILKGIAKQLPHDTPNLLWLGTTQYQDHEALAGEIKRRFARGLNRRLGGVMLALPTVYEAPGILNWVDWLQFVEHPNPRVRLPDVSFRALGLVAQMKLQRDEMRFPADRYALRWLFWKRITSY